MPDRVIVSVTDGIAEVRLNRPDKRNALDREQFAAIAAAGEGLMAASDVRVVVLVGEGESFCAGLDLSMFDGGLTADAPGALGEVADGRITHLAQQVCWVWQELPVPVIAAVHGHALGGGLQLALGADIRVSHPDARWSVREIHWGLVPDMAGTFALSRLVRPDVARELTYTGRIVDGREAHRLGLVTRLSDTPYDDALALAREIAGRSPGAVRGAKALFRRMYADGAAEQFAMEREVIAGQIGTPDQIEAVVANLEQRTPRFGA